MAIDEKDFVKFNYTGKDKRTGEVFDTTYEDVAVEAGIKIKDKKYNPITLPLDATYLLPKLQEELKNFEVGEKRAIEVDCEDAYGKRDPKAIQLIPMSEFKKQNIRPYVGMPVSYSGQNGIVRMVNGGRVRVDFNHRLAGKDLIFDLELVDIVEDDAEKIKGLIDAYYGNPNIDVEKTEIEFEDGIAKIILDPLSLFEQRTLQEVSLCKFRIAKEVYDNIEGLEEVQFIDQHKKPAPEEDSEESEEKAEEEAPEVLKDDE